MRLHIKVVLFIISAIIVSTGTSAFVASRLIRYSLESEFTEKGQVVAQTISELISQSVIDNDPVFTRSMLEKIVNRTQEMEYAYVVDFDGRLFAHSFQRGFPKKLLDNLNHVHKQEQTVDDHRKTLGRHDIAIKKYLLGNEPTFEVAFPLIEDMKAHVHIGLNERRIVDQFNLLVKNLLIVSAGVIFFWAVIGFIISRRLIAPIRSLMRTVIAYGHGNLEGAMEIPRAGGEIRELAESLNQMIINRREMESALRQSEEKVRLLLEHTDEAICGLDLNDRCTIANAAAVKALGYASMEEMRGMDIHELIHCQPPTPTLSPQDDFTICQALRERLDYHSDDIFLQRTDGSHFPAEYWSHPIFSDETIVGTVITFIDISKRRGNEAALRKSEARLAEAQRIAHIGNWEWSIASNKIFWSDEIYQIFGFAPKQFEPTYDRIITSIHPDDRNELQQLIEKAIENNIPFDNTHRIVRPDGSERIINERARVHRDEKGIPIRLVGTVHDVTEQKKAEAELRRYQGQLETLVEQRTKKLKNEINERKQAEERLKKLSFAIEESPVSVVMTNAAGKIEYVNPKFCRVTQYTPEEVIGKNPRILKSGQQPREYYKAMWETIMAGQEWHGEFCNKKKDGTMFWELASIAPIRNEVGKITHYVAIKEDITAQKQMIRDLQKAKEVADEANEAKSLFLSSMSHELRTPLNSILGFAQLLDSDEKHPLTGAHKQSLHRILKSGEHLLHLINEILDLARIEGGSLEMSMEAVGISETLADMVSLIEQLANRQQVKVMVKPADSQLYVQADDTRLKQVLMNLLSNGIKYNRPGGEVEISCHKYDESFLRLTVADNGPGIPADKIGALFEPFNRLGAESSSIEGTGIGLTITKRIVELMKGRIEVETELGKGCTFHVDLPLATKPAELATEPTESAVGLQKKPTGHYTLLYVEDNITNRQLVQFILARRSNYTLLTADNAELGIKIARRQQPDIILMDIGLPDMDGFAALKQLHELKETSRIPVVALSANAMPMEIEEGLNAGFVQYLTKPINVGQFFQVLDAVLCDNP